MQRAIAKPFARLRRGEILCPEIEYVFYTILILNDYKDAERRSAEGDASPLASRRPLETFGAVPLMLCFECSIAKKADIV